MDKRPGGWDSPFVRAVLKSCHGSQVVTIYATMTAAGDPGSNPALGKHGHVTARSSPPGESRPTPTLPDANLRYRTVTATKTLPTGAKGQKADGTSLLSAQF